LSERYDIVEEGGEEVTVVKVFCKRCPDYTLHTPEEAKRLEDNWESFQCANVDCVTNVKPGHAKLVTTTEICGACGKPYSRLGERFCYCPTKPIKAVKRVYDPFHKINSNTSDPVIQQVKNDIENSKTSRLLANKVRRARNEPLEIQKKTLALLEELAHPKKTEEKPKGINHGAIQ